MSLALAKGTGCEWEPGQSRNQFPASTKWPPSRNGIRPHRVRLGRPPGRTQRTAHGGTRTTVHATLATGPAKVHQQIGIAGVRFEVGAAQHQAEHLKARHTVASTDSGKPLLPARDFGANDASPLFSYFDRCACMWLAGLRWSATGCPVPRPTDFSLIGILLEPKIGRLLAA